MGVGERDMLVILTYSNIDSGCHTDARFLFIRMQTGSRARMAAIERIFGLFGRGSLLERGKDSLIVNGCKNRTGRGLRQSRRVIVLGAINPSPADRTICKCGTSGTGTGKNDKTQYHRKRYLRNLLSFSQYKSDNICYDIIYTN